MRVGALAAPAGLAVAAALITACAGQATLSPASSHGAGGNGAGGNGAGGNGSPAGGGATPVASQGAASSASASPSAAAAGGAGPSASAPSGRLADCAPWPAGSTSTTLDVDAVGNGRIYCVAIGDNVRVQLSGSELSTWKPLRLSGDALVAVPEPVRPALMPAFPLRSYRAVRPGDAMLYASRSCRAVQPQAAAAPQPTTAVMAYFGGTPISPGCVGPAESFRVTIVVS